MSVRKRATLLFVLCSSMSALFSAGRASADELLPNMIWKEGAMSESVREDWGQSTACDYIGIEGSGTCHNLASASSCSYKVSDDDSNSGAQVTAQFQCCDQARVNCGLWQWFSNGWTPAGGEISQTVCQHNTLHYAKISCLVAIPNPN